MALIEITGVVPDGSDYGPGVPANVRQAIKMTKGVDLTVRMRLINPRGAKIDVVNVAATHVLTIKKNPSDAPGLVSRAGAPQPQLGSNVVDFVLSPNDTRLLSDGNFGYDIFSTIATKRDATVPLSPWKIEAAMGLLNAPVTSVSLVPLTIFGLPMNGMLGYILAITNLDPFTVGWVANSGGGVPPIGVSGAVDIEEPANTLIRRRLTFDDIDPAFTGTFSGSFAAARALNSPLVNPQFTFTANATLSAVAGDVTVLDDTDTQNIVPPTSPFGYGGIGLLPARSYVSSVVNTTKSWDLKLTKLGGSPVIHRFVSVQFQPNVYFGKSASLGPYNSAFITGLSAPTLASGSNRDITTTTGAGEFVFYCFPTVFGGVAGDFIDLATNFPFGVSKVAAAVSVDNGFGVMVPIDVWRSDFPNLGTTTMRKQ